MSSSSSSSEEEGPSGGDQATRDHKGKDERALYGGDGGELFVDGNHPGIRSLAVHSGAVVDAIAVTYHGSDGELIHHGGQGGGKSEIVLERGEFVDRIEVRASDNEVKCITFKTSHGNVLGPCGGDGGLFSSARDNVVTAPPRKKLVGLVGRCGDRVDAIGFRFGRLNSLDMYGSDGGGLFDDGSRHGDIRSIAVCSGSLVDAIEVTYDGDEGALRRGGDGGGRSELVLEEDEFVDEVTVRSSESKGVQCLTFKTNKGNVLGPCGGNGGLFGGSGEEEVVRAPEGRKLSGFIGRSGDRIDAIGFRWSHI